MPQQIKCPTSGAILFKPTPAEKKAKQQEEDIAFLKEELAKLKAAGAKKAKTTE